MNPAPPGIAIRAFVADDAPRLAALFHAAVREVGRRHYSAAQCAAWSPAAPPAARYLARATTHRVLVAVDAGDVPVGYGDLEADGHIDHLYCHPDHVGRGIGSALLAALEAVARESAIARLTVEASEGARPLFERRGFTPLARNDVAIAGVAIHNYRMAKQVGCGAPDLGYRPPR